MGDIVDFVVKERVAAVLFCGDNPHPGGTRSLSTYRAEIGTFELEGSPVSRSRTQRFPAEDGFRVCWRPLYAVGLPHGVTLTCLTISEDPIGASFPHSCTSDSVARGPDDSEREHVDRESGAMPTLLFASGDEVVQVSPSSNGRHRSARSFIVCFYGSL